MSNLPNIKVPTLGGGQFWTDHFLHGDWRIQRNALSGKYRLLDPWNLQVASGTYEACWEAFHQAEASGKVEPLTETVVILLHGLGRTRHSMSKLARHLHEKTEWTAMRMEYASTQGKVAAHSAALRHIIARMKGPKTIHLVGHSLGNIVIRHYLRATDQRGRERRVDPRIGRIVMLAPPNRGAAMARLLKDAKVFQWIAGKAGQELAEQTEDFAARLGRPRQPFAIIAGNVLTSKGGNPLIPGPDDLVVGVDEARLEGATEFRVVSAAHTWIMNKPEVQTAVLQFLKTGSMEEKRGR